MYPPKPTFGLNDIPNLSGKVFIVTGGNTGVGKEIVKGLLLHDATVYLAARSQPKAEEAIRELKGITGKEAKFLQLDLSDLQSVKNAANSFTEQERSLHVLINNAGVMTPPIEQLTKAGHDMQFGTNVVGPWYFTKLLIPILQATAKEGAPARIVNVASTGALMTGGIKFDTLKDGPARKKLGAQSLYLQSKFATVVVSQELAKRYGDQGIVTTSLNPGTLKSDLARHVENPVLKFVNNMLQSPVEFGALTPLYVATVPEGINFNGQFFIPWARKSKLGPDALNEQLGKELWTWLEEQVATV